MISMGDHQSGAIFSSCERYRFRLWRNWGEGRRVLWIMLNPSTATHEILDPTVTRCRNYSRAWGYAGFEVCNLFAIRATNPRVIPYAPFPIGDGNDHHILQAAKEADLVMVAWGVHGAYRDRWRAVVEMLDANGVTMKCLKTTKAGHPCHPLYLKADLVPVIFKAKRVPWPKAQ
jgi:hypothetical protein